MQDRLTQGIHDCMDERGITLTNWRIKIVGREIIGNSDWATVTVEVYKPRCRKPCVVWMLAINIVREQIYWDRSRHYCPA